MKKISKILSLVLFSFTLGSYALAEVKMGFSVSAIDMEATATEEKFNAAANNHPAETEEMQIPMGSIFIEKDFGVLSIGLDIVPYDLESETLDNARTAQNGLNNAGQDTTDSKVTVTVETPVMIYALLQNDAGVFIRLGASNAKVKTVETITTGSTYPNAEIYGGHISLGMEKEFGDQGLSFRVEGGYSEYTNITVVNNQTARPTKIHVQDMTGVTARISLLKTY